MTGRVVTAGALLLALTTGCTGGGDAECVAAEGAAEQVMGNEITHPDYRIEDAQAVEVDSVSGFTSPSGRTYVVAGYVITGDSGGDRPVGVWVTDDPDAPGPVTPANNAAARFDFGRANRLQVPDESERLAIACLEQQGR